MQTNNTATVTSGTSPKCTAWDGRIYLIALMVVYEDANMSEITYWIDEGAPYMNMGSACSGDADEIFIYFNGTTGSSTALKYWTLGYPHVADATVDPAYTKLNGNNIGAYDYVETYGGYDVLYRWDNIPASYLDPSSNLFYYYDPAGSYERVYSAVLILEHGESAPDTTPPYTTGHDPAKDVTDVLLDTNIVIHVRDDGTGVDQSTIVMKVEGGVVTPTITGTQADYTLTYNPPADFDYGQVVDVTVDASDLNGTPNVMPTDSYSFTV
jgi:hypothetical protein